jgi:DNA-binding response OmpR family regulator
VTSDDGRPRVLVVDDERAVADVYAMRLQDRYVTEVAYGGEAAMEAVADADVVLLDRRMPELSGDEVLRRLRERDVDSRVVMLTAVDPDFDIVDLPFDDYLCKPVAQDDLVDAIEQQLTARRYDERLSQYLEVSSKLALLEAEKSPRELDDRKDVATLREREKELRAEIDDAIADFDDIDAAFREIQRRRRIRPLTQLLYDWPNNAHLFSSWLYKTVPGYGWLKDRLPV